MQHVESWKQVGSPLRLATTSLPLLFLLYLLLLLLLLLLMLCKR